MVGLTQQTPRMVMLHILGPKGVLQTSEPLIVQTQINNNWYDLFNKELGLQVPVGRGFFVCPRSYTPTAPKDGLGWRHDLSRPINEFTANFERRRRQYSVRLCDPEIISSRANIETGTPRTPQRQRRTRAPTPGPGARVPANNLQPQQRQRSAINRHAQNQPRGPTIIIRTRGSSPNLLTTSTIHRNITTTQAPAYNQNANYQRPRYNTANPSASQQLHYGTRLKRLREQQTFGDATSNVTPGPSNGVSHGPPQKKSKTVANPPQTRQSNRSGNPSVPRIDNIRSIVKVEPTAEPEWARYWDESEAEDDADGERPSNQKMFNGQQNGGAVDNDDFNSDSDANEDDDNVSMMTAATAEANELRRQGIQIEDVKSVVEGRIERFSNAYLLRVRNEIRKLQQNKLWDRNVTRSPLACYYLQELFKD